MLANTKRILKRWRREKSQIVVNEQRGVQTELGGKDVRTGHYVRVLMVSGYPPSILAGYLDYLDRMVSKEGAFLRKTIRYAASDIKWNRSMKFKLSRLERSIKSQSLTDPARKAEVAARDTIIALRDSNLTDDRKLVDVFTFLTISAPKLYMLEGAVANVKQWFRNMSGELDDLEREQLEGMKQAGTFTDPYSKSSEFFNKHHYGQVTIDSIAARTYPMTKGSFSDGEGPYFGNRVEDGSFCFVNICNPDDPRAQNITVLGKTGEGKSFFLKGLVVSLLEEGVHVFVFDLDGEWRDLCTAVGGTYIDHTGDDGRYIEPLNVMPAIPELDDECVYFNHNRLKRSMESGLRTFAQLAGKLTRPELHEVGEAIKRVYAAAGIDKRNPETWEGPYPEGTKPTLHKVFLEIEKVKDSNKHALQVYDNVKIYFIGIYSDFFRVEEPISFHDKPLVVYKVGNGEYEGEGGDLLAAQAQLKMSMAFDFVNSNIQKLRFEGERFSAVLVDEGQRQVQNPQLRRAVFDWYTSIRKWNGMMILASNSPSILLDNAQGQGMWENTSVRVYFFMETSAVRLLAGHNAIPVEIQHQISELEGSNQFVLEYHKRYDTLRMEVPQEEAKLYKTRGLKKKKAG